MVNFFNTTREVQQQMQADNFNNICLQIEHFSDGSKRWTFTIDPSNTDLIIYLWKRANSFLSLFEGVITEIIEGENVKPYFQKGVVFHAKLERALKKAAYLGKGLEQMRKNGMQGCILHKEYWQEALSCHHIAKPHHLQLEKIYKNFCKDALSFDDWIDTPQGQQAIKELLCHENSNNIEALKVIGLKEHERETYKIEFQKVKNHVILLYQGMPLDTQGFSSESGQGKAIFVIGPDQQLYVSSHQIGQFHHSSFFGGTPVIGAGEIITNPQGQLIEITDKSGHYKPCNPQLLNTLQFFQNQGLDLSLITLIKTPKSLMSKGNVYYSGRFNAQEFVTARGDLKPNPLEIRDYF